MFLQLLNKIVSIKINSDKKDRYQPLATPFTEVRFI